MTDVRTVVIEPTFEGWQVAARALLREEEMRQVEAGGATAAPFVPAGAGLGELREAARGCRGCDLYRHATQTVFGSGPVPARIVLVGEQPGDQEDLRGAPFVGPAGEVLDRALAARPGCPATAATSPTRPWLEAELGLIRPEVLVCLGATAARAIFGPGFRLLRDRGRFLPSRWTPRTLTTLHPSAVLRGQDEAEQARLYRLLAEDLRLAATGAPGAR